MNRFISVQYQKGTSSEFSNREYTYIDGIGLIVGDLVVAPTAKENRIAKVSRVGVPEDEIDKRILPILKTITMLHTKEEGVVENG